MPLTPKQAVGDKKSLLAAKLADIEFRIDAALSMFFDGKNPVKVSVDHNLDSWIEAQLKLKYEASGWFVTFDRYDDFRESWSYIVLKPKVSVL
jgi:hypothetical protein